LNELKAAGCLASVPDVSAMGYKTLAGSGPQRRAWKTVSLSRKVKTGLDENRLLILGAQVLFGFQFQGVFQEAFPELSQCSRKVDCLALVLMAITIALLVAPSMQHRIVEGGADTLRILRATGTFGVAALVPLGISLGLDFYIVFDHLFGRISAVVAGGAFCALAAVLWFGIGVVRRVRYKVTVPPEKEEETPLSTRIEQMLTEARVIVPGAQALLGFQLAVTFTRAFAELPEAQKIIHVGALCCVAVAIVILMATAAVHRVAFQGQDSTAFLKIGSAFVISAPFALAVGIAGDMQVAIHQATGAETAGFTLAAASLLLLLGLWYGVPLFLRRSQAKADSRHIEA
jgi:hypothetical protein